MAAVDGGGFNLEDDIGAKISGYRKEYDNDRDGRDEYGKWNYFPVVSLLHLDFKSPLTDRGRAECNSSPV